MEEQATLTPEAAGAALKAVRRRSSLGVLGDSLLQRAKAGESLLQRAKTSSESVLVRVKSFGRERSQIRSNVDLGEIDDELWWSAVPQPIHRLEKDMPSMRLASHVIKVLCVSRPPKVEDTQLHWFKKYQATGKLLPGQRYLVTSFEFGAVMFVALHEVTDDVFEDLLQGDFLSNSLKLIVMPINLPVPVPLKGPKDAQTIGKFFGGRNIRFSRGVTEGVDCATLTIDLYSVFSLRMAMPKIAFKTGRIVDFHVVSYDHKASLASLRIATTPELIRQMKERVG